MPIVSMVAYYELYSYKYKPTSVYIPKLQRGHICMCICAPHPFLRTCDRGGKHVKYRIIMCYR